MTQDIGGGPLEPLVFGYRTLYSGLTQLIRRAKVNFDPAVFTVVDNPVTFATDVGLVDGGGGGGGAALGQMFYGVASDPQTVDAGGPIIIGTVMKNTFPEGVFDGSAVFMLPFGVYEVTVDLSIVHSNGSPASFGVGTSNAPDGVSSNSILTSEEAGVADGKRVRVSATSIALSGDAQYLSIRNLGADGAQVDGGVYSGGRAAAITIIRIL